MKQQLFIIFLLGCFVWKPFSCRPSCEDNVCGLEKVEQSLKLALDVIKLVKDESAEDNNNDFSSPPPTIEYSSESSQERTSIALTTPKPLSTTTDDSINENNDKCKVFPANCAEIMVLGYTKSGVYDIYPKWEMNPKPHQVYCDLTNEGGGWTTIQRRNDYKTIPRQSFNKTWVEYKNGFGNLKEEFWLGNDLISNLTTQDRMILRLEVEDWEGQKRFSHYKGFIVQNEETNYTLNYSLYYDSTIGYDQLDVSRNKTFLTPDRDSTTNKPAVALGTGFWFPDFQVNYLYINPNGIYYDKDNHLDKDDGIICFTFKGHGYSLKRLEMKLRPEYFIPNESTV